MNITIPDTIHTLLIQRDITIDAPIDVVFASLLDELGPEGQLPGGQPFPKVLEAWPGGRWFRDLGNNTGHLWGHVQVIKPPTLLEICGPMFMSFAAVSHLQYRLKAEGSGTQMSLCHRAMGTIPLEHREQVGSGWEQSMNRVRELAGRRRAGLVK